MGMKTCRTPRPAEKPRMSSTKKVFLRLGAFIGIPLLLIGGILLYIHATHYESTDDAFIDGHIVPISAKVAGQVLSMTITDNQLVKQGDTLIEIDPRDYQTLVAQQSAKADAAMADAQSATSDAKRYAEIYKNDEVSKQQLDNAESDAACRNRQRTKRKRRRSIRIN